MEFVPSMFLNDGETFSSIDGCIVVDRHGIAYDAAQVWNRIPISIRETCRIGMAVDVLALDKLEVEGSWP